MQNYFLMELKDLEKQGESILKTIVKEEKPF